MGCTKKPADCQEVEAGISAMELEAEYPASELIQDNATVGKEMPASKTLWGQLEIVC